MHVFPMCTRYVGYHYAAESLLLLNRYDEALQYLNPEIVGNLDVVNPSTRTLFNHTVEPLIVDPPTKGGT